uniref:Transcriptional coactivator caper rrm superfamily n=1 Tax=Rhipicephalus zambeziensis TaxID=60191 RepID=A0A224ZAS3_9ACAR
MTRNSPMRSERTPPSAYSRTDTDNSRHGTSRRRSSSRSRSRSGSRSRDRHGSSSRGSGSHRSHRRRGDRSRSRERPHRRDRDRSRSRSHRRSRSRSGSRSRKVFSKRSSAERFEMEDRALAPSASSTAARALAVSAAATVSQASALSVSAATPSSTSAPPPGVSAALAAARAAAVRSGLMSVEALNAPPPQIPNSLPSYYNPTAVNALKYTEQMQKRKLLWKKPQQDEVAAETEAPNPQPNSTCAKVWEKMTFAQDDDGKMTAKFRKLMGIRGDPPPPTEKPDPAVNPLLKQQEKLFQDLDQQYEAARVSTHTHRGVGLGYSSQMAAFFQQTNLNTK